jgi:hypothetical protein
VNENGAALNAAPFSIAPNFTSQYFKWLNTHNPKINACDSCGCSAGDCLAAIDLVIAIPSRFHNADHRGSDNRVSQDVADASRTIQLVQGEGDAAFDV